VILTATPLSGLAPLTVTADASRSTDANGIVGYAFDFGDGTAIIPSRGTTATHMYCLGGIYRLTVTVTNKLGLSANAFLFIAVTQPVNPVSC
jgi:PKD repeat protein